MRRFVEFWRLPPRDRELLIRAGILVVLVRLALWTRPYQAIRRRLDRWSGVGVSTTGPHTPTRKVLVERVTWAVRAAGRMVPDATCLTQALAAHALLGRAGRSSDIRFGVARGDGGSFQAHAWLEVDGDVVLGRLHDLDRYTPLRTPHEPNP